MDMPIPNERTVRKMIDSLRRGIGVDNKALLRGVIFMGAKKMGMTVKDAMAEVAKADEHIADKAVIFRVEFV